MDSNSFHSRCKERISDLMTLAGAFRIGVATATEIDPDAINVYDSWIASGRHASMAYMERYEEIRRDPRLLLDDAQSLIVAAFSYATTERQSQDALQFARYALGSDYHTVLRQRLEPVALAIEEDYGAKCRICIDTAPLRERYWAARAGVGFIGRNNQLIIPGAGSWFVLATLITTLPLPPDQPLQTTCGDCRRCIEACPGKALSMHGDGVDARRCLSYLTIEHRGDLPAGVRLGNHIYGCDVCQMVCPYNRETIAPPALPEFEPRRAILELTPQAIADMTKEQFSIIFRNSAVKRTKLEGLQRNLKNISGGRIKCVSS